MSRLHTDPVEVRHRDGEPTQFLWRHRLYVVREVLAQWSEAGQWWRTSAMSVLGSGDASATSLPARQPGAGLPEALETVPIPASPAWAQRAWGEPAPDLGAAVRTVGVDDGERDWWRVEAAAGAAGSGVYDLCFDCSRGAWSLARVLD